MSDQPTEGSQQAVQFYTTCLTTYLTDFNIHIFESPT